MNLNILAWRNLWRHKRRTLITASSIAFAVLLTVTFTGAGDYFYTRMIDAGANMGMGHITVAAADYNRAPSTKKSIQNADQIRAQLEQLMDVKAVMARIQAQAMFASAHNTVGGLFFAVDPGQESAESNLFIKAMVKGTIAVSPAEKTIVLGVGLAKKLKLTLGKKVVHDYR